MVDIAKCSGADCPVREHCHRFKAKADEIRQSYVIAPYKIENGVFSCDLFWGESQTQILNQLEEIVGIRKQHK